MTNQSNKYSEAIDSLAQKYRTELEELDVIDGNESPEDDDDVVTDFITAFNLAELNIKDWRELTVSNISKFGDWSWDFRDQGSPLYTDTASVNWDVLLPESVEDMDRYETLLTLMRSLLFYMLPTNSMVRNIRSYNTVLALSKQLKLLCRFLMERDVYVDLDGDGTFKVVNDISPDHFVEFLNGLESNTERYHFISHVRHWRHLSTGGLLPPIFDLSYDVFSKQELSKATLGFDESKGQFLPINIDTLSSMLPFAIQIIEDFGKDIVKLYNLMYPVVAGGDIYKNSNFCWHDALTTMESIQTELWSMEDFVDKNKTMSGRIKTELCQEIRSRGHWHGSSSALYKITVSEALELAEVAGIDLYQFNKAIHYDLTAVKDVVKNLSSLLRNAIAFVVFLVTGMRRSEFANLEANSFWKVKGKDEYCLRVTIFKTSDMSQGEDHLIPIPSIAYVALGYLRDLTEVARKHSGTDCLGVNFTSSFGKKMTLNAINQFFQRWSEALGVEHIHPHQFRKTIAMFAIYQDTMNLPIIKHLFGHKSLKMTLAYIVKMPGVSQEIKIALLEQNKELLIELLESAESGIISGIAGNRIKNNFKENKVYSAMLHDDGWETLEQYIDVMLDEGVSLLHRAPLGVICTKTPSVEQPAPCDINKTDKISRLHPDVQRCDSLNCQWGAFTESSMDKLGDEITFHQGLIDHPYCSDSQKKFSQKRIELASKYLHELRAANDENIHDVVQLHKDAS